MVINDNHNTFEKSGKEFKQVLEIKISELKSRLSRRNIILDELLNDKKRLRSYLLRSGADLNEGNYHRGGFPTSYSRNHIGIEEVEEIKQLCNRIFQIENEIKTYTTIRNNLQDEDAVRLTLEELMQYGFE